MSAPGQQLIYDPVAVFVDLASDLQFAADLAKDFSCSEATALAGLLEAHGRPATAVHWLACHLLDCDDPPRHLR